MPPRPTPYPSQIIRRYTVQMSKKWDPLACPQCQETIFMRDFEKHCRTQHALNTELGCAWCQGDIQWPKGQKWKHVDHLRSCSKNFKLLHRPDAFLPSTPPPPAAPPPPPPPRPTPFPFDLEPMHVKRCFFDPVFDPPPHRACDPVWPMPLDPNLLTFQDESLNRAVSCVRKYLELPDTTEWFHAKVRSVAFPSFLEAMDADEGKSRTLPFSCWCDGGTPSEPSHRQHRHLLVVSSPRGHFIPNVWKKMVVPQDWLPRKNFRCVHLEPIRDTMHLVNALGYVSSRKSQCTFSGDFKKGPVKDHHFYLFESLPKDYRLPLVLQWEGALLQLLHQDFKNLKMGQLVRAPCEYLDSKWRFQIQHIPGITLHTVLPVSRDLQPVSHATTTPLAFLHLVGGRKLYFERHDLLGDLKPDAWLERQAEGGNLFYHIVAEDHWTPRPHHQALLNEFRPLVLRNRELQADNTRLRERLAALEQEHAPCQGIRDQLEAEKAHWERKASNRKEKTRFWKEKCHGLEEEQKVLQEKEEVLNEIICLLE